MAFEAEAGVGMNYLSAYEYDLFTKYLWK